MAAAKLGPQERKDLDKYIKHMVYKFAQIIIQSRSGERVNTPSKIVASGTDWFNLSIRDDPDILSETKRTYGSNDLMTGQKVCLEIFRRDSNNEEVMLETWYLESNDICDTNIRVSYGVYNYIGTLLRSLLLFTRVLPAHKISKGQASGRYLICHRIYLGSPKFNLGDRYGQSTIGFVPTPVGTIALMVAYRQECSFPTKLGEPDKLEKNFRDNHYSTENVSYQPGSCKILAQEFRSGENNLREAERSSATDGSCHNVKQTCERSKTGVAEAEVEPVQNADPSSPSSALNHLTDANYEQCSDSSTENKTKRKKLPSESDSKAELERSLQPMVVASGSSASGHSSPSAALAPDDFVVLDLKTPFADNGPEVEELEKFYEEWKNPPPLFPETVDYHEMLNSITDQLAQFEANAKDFDEFVKSITDETDNAKGDN